MKLGEFKQALKGLNDDTEILIASDEELNCMMKKLEIATLSDRENTIVIYGFASSEVN